MSAFNQTLPTEFDATKLCFTEPPKPMGTQGGRIVSVTYDGRPLVIETDRLHAPYGMNQYDEPGGGSKFSLALSFRDYENNGKIAALQDTLNAIDAAVLQAAADNCQTWFKKAMSIEILDALYSRSVRPARDKETGEVIDQYPPTFTLKVPVYDGKLGAKAFDAERKIVDVEETKLTEWIPRGSRVKTLMRFGGVWIAAGKFGLLWRMAAAQVIPPEMPNGGFCFRDDDSPPCVSSSAQDQPGQDTMPDSEDEALFP